MIFQPSDGQGDRAEVYKASDSHNRILSAGHDTDPTLDRAVAALRDEGIGEGPSADVVSRTLLFRNPAGAAAYVAFVADHAASYWGPGTAVQPVTSAGRPGFFVRGASCGCHRESPILVTVVSQRARVSWLLVNGPGATRARAEALAAHMP